VLDLERKGMLRGVGTGVNALRSFKVLGLLQRPSLESWGSSEGLIYMSYLVIYLTSQGMRSKPW